MKRTIYIILTSLLAVNMQAQVIDNERLQAFINELKALNSEHVMCETESFTPTAHLEFPEGLVVFKFRDQDSPFTGITTSDTTFRYVHSVSEDDAGYILMLGIINKYYDYESEDIFGIPLMACQREDGEEQTLFMDENNTLTIRDNGYDELEILYTNYNLINSIKRTLQSALEVFDEEYVDVNIFGGMDFSVKVTDVAQLGKDNDDYDAYKPSADCDDILESARRIFENNTSILEEELAKAKSDEEREEAAAMLAKFKRECDESLADMEKELAELNWPSFFEIIPGSNEYVIAIPRVPAELKEKQKPYAASGVYDWINKYYSFRSGAKNGITDIVSCIVTPRDVARECVIRNYPRSKWYDEGFAPEYKELAATEYQGGTPAVLYSFSQTEKGYNDLLTEFDYLFRMKPGERMSGLEVTQQSENNGKRFVQLWGEGGILMCFFDSPAEKYCHMSIVIGGVSGFEQAVNEYCFGGEKDFAKRCNIVIDSDLGNNSYGIHFANDEYFYAGKSHKNGVHIDFGYARMFIGEEP